MDILEPDDYCMFRLNQSELNALLQELNGNHPTLRVPEVLSKIYRIDRVEWKSVHEQDDTREKFYHLGGTPENEIYPQEWFKRCQPPEASSV